VQYDFNLVAAYIEGFVIALEGVRPRISVWGDFRRWVEAYFGVCDPGWHWSHILLHATGSHEKALEKLSILFEQFLDNGPLVDPLEWVAQRLREKRGASLYAPPEAEHPFHKDYPSFHPT
jgi:hypothetical protein